MYVCMYVLIKQINFKIRTFIYQLIEKDLKYYFNEKKKKKIQ